MQKVTISELSSLSGYLHQVIVEDLRREVLRTPYTEIVTETPLRIEGVVAHLVWSTRTDDPDDGHRRVRMYEREWANLHRTGMLYLSSSGITYSLASFNPKRKWLTLGGSWKEFSEVNKFLANRIYKMFCESSEFVKIIKEGDK